jgi:small subunit ribosomal protein S6
VQPVTTYETVFITLPSLTEQEETDLVGSLAQIVTDDGGTMVANDRMGRRRLAYPIRKFEDGVYTRFLYDSSALVPKELDRRIRLSDKILRHLTVRLEPDWAVAAKEQAVRDAEAREEAAKAAAAAAAEAAEAEARREAEAAAASGEAPAEAAEGPEASQETAPGEPGSAPVGDAPEESTEEPAKKPADESADA